MERHVAGQSSPQRLDRRLESEHLFDRVRDPGRVRYELRSGFGVAREQDDAVAHEVRHGVGAREDEVATDPAQLVVVEGLAARGVAGLALQRLDQAWRRGRRIALHDADREVRELIHETTELIRALRGSDPECDSAHRLVERLRDAHQPVDHETRETGSEALDEIEGRFAFERFEECVDDPADLRR